MQLASAGALAGDCVLAGHIKQCVDETIPANVLYLPLGQSVHASSSVLGPYLPAGHCVQTLAPAGA